MNRIELIRSPVQDVVGSCAVTRIHDRGYGGPAGGVVESEGGAEVGAGGGFVPSDGSCLSTESGSDHQKGNFEKCVS